MSPKSIWLIDKRADLCHNPRQNRNVVRGLAKAVRLSLFLESHRRAKEDAKAIWVYL